MVHHSSWSINTFTRFILIFTNTQLTHERANICLDSPSSSFTCTKTRENKTHMLRTHWHTLDHLLHAATLTFHHKSTNLAQYTKHQTLASQIRRNNPTQIKKKNKKTREWKPSPAAIRSSSTVERDRVTFSNRVAVWSARWWRVEGVTTPFSLAEEERQGLGWVGAGVTPTKAGVRASMALACPDRGGWYGGGKSWLATEVRRRSLARRRKKRGSRRRHCRWWLASTAWPLAGDGTCGGGSDVVVCGDRKKSCVCVDIRLIRLVGFRKSWTLLRAPPSFSFTPPGFGSIRIFTAHPLFYLYTSMFIFSFLRAPPF